MQIVKVNYFLGSQICKINNGGCSHLCLLTPGGFLCACPDGLRLLPDGKNCQTGKEVSLDINEF